MEGLSLGIRYFSILYTSVKLGLCSDLLKGVLAVFPHPAHVFYACTDHPDHKED